MAIAFVQNVQVSTAGSTSSQNLNITPAAAGNIILAAVQNNSGTLAITSGVGTLVPLIITGYGPNLYYFIALSTAQVTLTASYSPAATFTAIIAAEYSGVGAVEPIGDYSAGGTAANVLTITGPSLLADASNAGAWSVEFGNVYGNIFAGYASTSGQTVRIASYNNGSFLADRAVSSGTVQDTGTVGQANFGSGITAVILKTSSISTIRLVNSKAAQSWDGTNHGSISLPAFNAVAGNFIFLTLLVSGSSTGTPTDTAGNTYILLPGSYNSTSNGTTVCWYAKNILGNASNVITIPATTAYTTACVAQWSGVDRKHPLDTAASRAGTGTNTTMTTSTFDTRYLVELCVGGASWEGYNNSYNTPVWPITIQDGETHGYLQSIRFATAQTAIAGGGTTPNPSNGWTLNTFAFIAAGQVPNGAGLLLGVG